MRASTGESLGSRRAAKRKNCGSPSAFAFAQVAFRVGLFQIGNRELRVVLQGVEVLVAEE